MTPLNFLEKNHSYFIISRRSLWSILISLPWYFLESYWRYKYNIQINLEIFFFINKWKTDEETFLSAASFILTIRLNSFSNARYRHSENEVRCWRDFYEGSVLETLLMILFSFQRAENPHLDNFSHGDFPFLNFDHPNRLCFSCKVFLDDSQEFPINIRFQA